jgi:DNA-binding beta-propeller fold protein YncE
MNQRQLNRQGTPAGIAVFMLVLLGTAAAATEEGPAALELVRKIALRGPSGRLDHLALDAKNSRLFVANLSNNSLDVVDLKGGKLLKQVTGQNKIQGIAYDPDLDRIFVGNGGDGVCNALDGRSYRLLHTIKLPGADNVRYDHRTRQVYVGHAENSLTAIDARTFEVKATIKLPASPKAFQIDPTRPRLYANTTPPSQLVEIDTDKNEVVARHSPTARNYALALDPAGRRFFVGCREKPLIVVLDAKTGKKAAEVEVPRDIDDLFFDATRKRLYATCGEGYLVVVQEKSGDGYEVIGKISTAKLARTSLFDPDNGRLYVAMPGQDGGEGPHIRVYQAKP